MKYTNVSMPLPGPKSKAILDEWKKYENKTGFQAPVAISKAEGAMLIDADDNRFIDWTSGVLVTNIGHCHPKLVEAVQKASADMMNVYEYGNHYRMEAAKRLSEAAPDHLKQVFFLSTGGEATDSAVRIMKRATGKYEILSFYGGFHGRIQSMASVGGMSKTKKNFGPSMPGVLRAPFPYCYRCPFNSDPEHCGHMCLEFVDEMIRANSTGSLAGCIVEPYLGTAGFIIPPKGYMPALEKLLREHDMLFTLDEVQASYGRTGTMWALEHENLTPDIVTVGKGIGSGMSVSAVLMRPEVIDKALEPGEIGSTYGGNPVSCAAVTAVLDVMQQEKIIDNVNRISPIFEKRLNEMKEKCAHLGDVRGMGLVWGLELVEDKAGKIPAPALAKKLVGLCAQNGLLIGIVGTFGNVIRVAPPLVINEEQAYESLEIMERSLMML